MYYIKWCILCKKDQRHFQRRWYGWLRMQNWNLKGHPHISHPNSSISVYYTCLTVMLNSQLYWIFHKLNCKMMLMFFHDLWHRPFSPLLFLTTNYTFYPSTNTYFRSIFSSYLSANEHLFGFVLLLYQIDVELLRIEKMVMQILVNFSIITVWSESHLKMKMY